MAPVDAEFDLIRRPELETTVDALRRELSGYAKTHAELRGELNAKLDQILLSKTEDARAMGQLQEKVEQLSSQMEKQAAEIKEIRQKQEEPRDRLLSFVVDIVKLVIAAGLGAFFAVVIRK